MSATPVAAFDLLRIHFDVRCWTLDVGRSTLTIASRHAILVPKVQEDSMRTRRLGGREPDFAQFLKVLKRDGRPSHLPFYEHLASPGFLEERTGKPVSRMRPGDPAYWPTVVDFWLGMGYD